MNKLAILACLPLVSLMGCSSYSDDSHEGEPIGEAMAAISLVPDGVQCISLVASAPSGDTTQSVAVTGGQQGVVLKLQKLPLGMVTFKGAAYDQTCSALTPTTVPSWVGGPVQVALEYRVTAQVNLKLRKNGTADVSVDFEEDDAGAACTTGTADCDNDPANGCETDLMSQPTNCGACGMACATPPNASVACLQGACVAGPCSAGFADCNNHPADGCESNLRTDVTNCGACGNKCSTTNSTSSCVAAQCVLSTCAAGWGNCDGTASNGCEVNVATDPQNCGACGNMCPALPNSMRMCVAGTCGFSCNTGFGNCDATMANGCEVALNTSVQHCGMCGRACLAGQICTGGQCI